MIYLSSLSDYLQWYSLLLVKTTLIFDKRTNFVQIMLNSHSSVFLKKKKFVFVIYFSRRISCYLMAFTFEMPAFRWTSQLQLSVPNCCSLTSLNKLYKCFSFQFFHTLLIESIEEVLKSVLLIKCIHIYVCI